jgi:pimeloyl-ACP methyl ester carboxylesterase
MGMSRSSELTLRSGRHHLRHWGDEEAPLVLALHGWLDVSATFEFLAAALPPRWHVVAPDWRGYGRSEWQHRPYWWAEFMADLDELADRLSPDAPLRIVGHSMGGNIATLWAAARPARVAQLVLLEAFGHPPDGELFPAAMYERWLDDARGPRPFPVYQDRAAFAARLMATNPRLGPARADRLAAGATRHHPDGGVVFDADPWHRSAFNHLIHSSDHFLGAWARIDAPVLWVTGDESETLEQLARSFGSDERLRSRLRRIPRLQAHELARAGHHVQHDQPEALAALIDGFLRAG